MTRGLELLARYFHGNLVAGWNSSYVDLSDRSPLARACISARSRDSFPEVRVSQEVQSPGPQQSRPADIAAIQIDGSPAMLPIRLFANASGTQQI